MIIMKHINSLYLINIHLKSNNSVLTKVFINIIK